MFTRKLCSFGYRYRKLSFPRVSRATFRQILTSSAVLISSFLHGCKDGYLQVAVPIFMSKEAPFKVAESYISWIASISFSGVVLAVTCRYVLGDRLSRKWFLLACALITTISWFSILVTSSAAVLITCLFFYGAVSNTFNIVGQMYMGEVASPENRELLGFLFVLLYAVGTQVETFLATFGNYQTLAFFPFLVTIINVLSGVFMVESPCYLMMMGQKEEALESLCWLNDESISQSPLLTNELDNIGSYVNEKSDTKINDRQIVFLPENLKLIVVMMIVDAAVFINCDMILSAYGPLMVSCFEPVLDGVIFTNIRNAFMLCGSILSYFTLRMFNRRALLLFGFITSAVVHAVLAICYLVEERHDNKIFSLIILIAFLLFVLVAICTPVCETAICILKMEVFPYRVKELYICLMEITGNAACFMVVKFYIIMSQSLGMCMLLLLYSAVACISTILISKSICNTKGKTLYEVRSEIMAE